MNAFRDVRIIPLQFFFFNFFFESVGLQSMTQKKIVNSKRKLLSLSLSLSLSQTNGTNIDISHLLGVAGNIYWGLKYSMKG